MNQENIVKILSGANKLFRQSRKAMQKSSASYIEQEIIKGKYVTREEYEQLHALVIKLNQELELLKK